MDERNYYEPECEVTEVQKEETPSWFPDDFETIHKNRVPKSRALSVYKPKKKRATKLFKSPVFAAVVSSVLTCMICLSIFSVVFRPRFEEPVLPTPGAAYGNRVLEGEISQMAYQTKGKTFSIPEVYDLASPSVVSILCVSRAGGYYQSQMSSGSGIIIRKDGYIVTNNHVVEGAAKITVITIAGQEFEASLVGRDARTDLAVLKVESEDALPFAELGDSSTIRVGEMALAIGNPLREELAGTLTVGYISAINRSMEIDGKQMTMLQTDAAINPGNSGGALLNMAGQVIGINTAKSTGYDVEGLGFAIPINEAKPIIESIIRHGYVTGRPIIGIKGIDVTEAIAKANDLPIGVYVKEVVEGGSADKAGIKLGDVIIKCDGKEVTTIDEINKIKDGHKAGETMKMTVDRNGTKRVFNVILQEEKPAEEEEVKELIIPEQSQQQFPFPFDWFGW